MKERTAFTYEIHYCVAEFGEDTVTVEASNREEADEKINTWCKENHAVNSDSASGAGPKPYLMHQGFLIKTGQ